jgi:hypothetical protein
MSLSFTESNMELLRVLTMHLKRFIFAAALIFSALTWGALADDHHSHAHTHIGRNRDQTHGTGDDNKLWLFSEPGLPEFPGWPVLELKPTGIFDPSTGKQNYICDYLFCWHSAHPQHGNWQLGGDNENIVPGWDIHLKRVAFDEGFFVLAGRDLILANDGDEVSLGAEKEWMPDEYNENGQPGAWGFEVHHYFHAWADGPGQIFTATFQALDYGSTAFTASDEFTFTFVTVPEPLTVALLAAGVCAIGPRRRR